MSLTFANGVVRTADLPPIDGIVQEQLSRACIKIEEYLPNMNSIVVGTEFENPEAKVTSWSIPTSTENFWSIRILGTFRCQNLVGIGTSEVIESAKILGAYYCTDKSISIYNWTNEAALEAWNDENPSQQIGESSLSDLIRATVLHEIGHALGLSHTSGVMESGQSMIDRTQPFYQQFTIDDLLDIQAHLLPHDPNSVEII